MWLGWVLGWTGISAATAALSPIPLGSSEPWRLAEFRIDGMPAASNPFDPAIIALDAAFTAPSGRQWVVPAFWYQRYQRGYASGRETLATQGQAEWRLRTTPTETGSHQLVLRLRTNGVLAATVTNTVVVGAVANPPARPGYVRVAASGRYFETDAGAPLPLVGHCACWHGARGTFDYDDWFASMQAAGENFTRLWMCPWAFGLETDAGTLTRYRLDRAWQLDYVLQLAEARGIYVMLCLDYHGMFEVDPDYWGGNNYWPSNPYNAAKGGPCANQDAFFTSATAQATYQKRLRYLVARYGYSRNLLAWEFFNEIDNVSKYLDSGHVATWHGVMGTWLKANDPARHLVTTSLSGGDRPELWQLPQLDFAMHHSYGAPQPAATLATVQQTLATRYGKPVMVGEYGTDWRGWAREQDPYLRGWRQGLWAGALGGSVGTSMSWFWENIASENLYPTYRALSGFLGGTGWGQGSWTPLAFATSGDPPILVDALVAGGAPFDAQLLVSGQWGAKPSGRLALARPISATWSSTYLNAFVHGTGHPELKTPFKVDAWLGTGAQLTLHVNSVSDGARVAVYRDNVKFYDVALPNLDGGYQVNNEYNTNLVVALPAGHHLIEVRNTGGDWFYLDWVRFEHVLPTDYPGGWQPSPVAVGLKGATESLVYVVSPQVSFPANATVANVETTHGTSLVITNLPPGRYQAAWSRPADGTFVGESPGVADGTRITFALPDYVEDLVGRIRPVTDVSLNSPEWSEPGQFTARLHGPPGWRVSLESSLTLKDWMPLAVVTNSTGTVSWRDPDAVGAARYYRARLLP